MIAILDLVVDGSIPSETNLDVEATGPARNIVMCVESRSSIVSAGRNFDGEMILFPQLRI